MRLSLIRVCAVVLIALLGACSDDDDSDEATPTTGALTSTSASAAATSSTAPVTIDCPTVGFTPQSEDAASSVKATGVSCAEAEAFLRVAGPKTSPGGPSSLQVEGYRCVLTKSVDDPLPQGFYECESGAKKITFVRS